MGKPHSSTAPKKQAVLDAMAHTLTVTAALEEAGFNENAHQNWIKRDPDYRADIEVAKLEQSTRRGIARQVADAEKGLNRQQAKSNAKLQNQNKFLEIMGRSRTIQEACDAAGIPRSRYENWNRKDTAFRRRAKPIKEEMERRYHLSSKKVTAVYDPDRELPPRLPFREWRMHYLGRPVLTHQEHIVDAWEDKTNRIVIVLGPTGMGKDTTAGDFLLYEHHDDREGLRSMWMMESAPMSKRRIAQRLDPYLTDRKVYNLKPEGSTSEVPKGNLIDDYGPYKWEKGMVYPDGTSVDSTTWTQNEIYLLGSVAPESDPNLWATGIGGAIYGSRIQRAYLSDLFTRENQINPELMQTQRNFVDGTLKSRLDGRGRALFIGTRVAYNDNYGHYLNRYVANARVIAVEETTHSTYTKYSNGTAVVIIKAIGVNADGEDESFWEDKFPLESYLIDTDGNRHRVEDLDEKQYMALADAGAEFVEGLYDLRADNPELFATMQMQDPPTNFSGDFTDEVLDRADDPGRTYEIAYPNEIIVVGVDPARTAGAAYVVWAVDRAERTATVVDAFYGERLGISGIKKQLVMAPIAKWDPLWYCYEINKEAAVLDDPTIKQVFKEAAVSVWPYHTGYERGNYRPGGNQQIRKQRIGVPALGFYMRSQQIRWPTQTAEDRRMTDKIKEHFKSWDARELGVRTRSGTGGHKPDDLAMAAWIGFIKCLEIMDGTQKIHSRRMPVPPSVRRRWDRMLEKQKEKQHVANRPPRVTATNREIVTMMLGGPDAHHD